MLELDHGSELMKLLEHMQLSIDDLYGIWHAFSGVATEHLGAARPSVKPNEETIWY